MNQPKIYKNYYDVVILPTGKVRDNAISLSKQLHKFGTSWVLGKKYFIPHISLYHIPVKPKDFRKFVNELETIVKGNRARNLKVSGLRPRRKSEIAMLTTEKPEWLVKLHLLVVKKTLQYFDWDYGVDKIWHTNRWPKARQRLIKKFGTPSVGNFFKPHISLGVSRNLKSETKALRSFKPKRIGFSVKSIFICELGKNQSCQRIVKEIHF